MTTRTGILLVTIGACIFGGCLENNNSTQEKGVVKIVKTSAFSSKTDFEKLVPDKPEYWLGYDRTMGLDFSWRIEQFDKFDNIILLEGHSINEDGKEEIYFRESSNYYFPKEGKLSTINIGKSIKQIYVWNEELLKEIHTTDHDKLVLKSIFTYNEFGQKVSEEIFNQNGTVELLEYEYDHNNPLIGKVKTEVHFYYDEDGSYERYVRNYSYDNNHNIKTLRKQRFSGHRFIGKETLRDDLENEYSDYVGENASKEHSKGFTTSKITTMEGKLLRYERSDVNYMIERDFSDKGHILSYRKKELDAEGNESFSFENCYYKCDYTYNDKGEWIKIIMDVGSTKYIALREITYLK